MQPLVTAELMRHLDRVTIERFGVPGVALMENAGRSVVAGLRQHVPALETKRVTIVCGKGNNGGDGFVIARHLANAGCTVRVLLLAKEKELSPDAAVHWKTVMVMAGKGALAIRRILSAKALQSEPQPEILVDALFGTGFAGAPRGVHAAAIRWMTSAGAFVVAVDIPSGVHGTTGHAEGETVRANLTVTLALAKVGNVVGQGYERGGVLAVGEIGMPSLIVKQQRFPAFRVEQSDVTAKLPHRPLRAHKYNAGKVFVLAGSRSFTGAAVLCAEAALRSGAGAVILGIPRSIHHVLAKKVTEVILVPLAETAEGTVAPEGREEILRRCAWADVVAIGPGMGRNEATDALVRDLAATVDRAMVVDADALTAVAADLRVLRRSGAPRAVTPHAGELARLLKLPSAAIEADPLGSARRAVRTLGCVIALKGAPTLVAAPGSPVIVNGTGNPGMATIGSGDVLTGVISGLCAQGMDLLEATWAGVFVHGRAGDLASAGLGERSVLAGDILHQLPEALRSCER